MWRGDIHINSIIYNYIFYCAEYIIRVDIKRIQIIYMLFTNQDWYTGWTLLNSYVGGDIFNGRSSTIGTTADKQSIHTYISVQFRPKRRYLHLHFHPDLQSLEIILIDYFVLLVIFQNVLGQSAQLLHGFKQIYFNN